MNPVVLHPAEVAVCKMMGNLRSHASRVAGSKSSSFGNAIENDEDGFIGEYAFCKANNLFPDITGIPRRRGYDCLFKGHRIDVKTTKYKNGKLMVYDSNNTEVDVYVMAIVDGDTVTFPGYCTVKRFYEESAKFANSDGQTFRYEMTQDKLTPWKEDMSI